MRLGDEKKQEHLKVFRPEFRDGLLIINLGSASYLLTLSGPGGGTHRPKCRAQMTRFTAAIQKLLIL